MVTTIADDLANLLDGRTLRIVEQMRVSGGRART
jgi:hypothetical protein